MPKDSDFLDLAKMRQRRIFFPNYQATGSLRNHKQSDSIPPWKDSFMICPKGLVKKYRGDGPEHLEMCLIKNT